MKQDTIEPMSEYIELSIRKDGQTISVREALPPLLKCSSGPLSCKGAICASLDRLTQRMSELLAREQKHEFIRFGEDRI